MKIYVLFYHCWNDETAHPEPEFVNVYASRASAEARAISNNVKPEDETNTHLRAADAGAPIYYEIVERDLLP